MRDADSVPAADGADAGAVDVVDTSTAPSAGDRSAWRIRPFRRVWAASALSLLGAELGDLALPLLALLVLEARPAEMAALRAAQFVPFVMFALLLGVLVDRVRRRRLLITADLGRGLVLVLVVVGVLSGVMSPARLVAAAFVVGSFTVLYQLADFAFLPHVVPEQRLADANAKITATGSVMSLIGTGAGGALVQALTAPVTVLVNAFAYLSSATILRTVRVAEVATPPAPGVARARAWAQMREGAVFLIRHRVLRALAGEAATWNLFYEILLLGLTLHVVATFPYGPLALGGLLMFAGVGAVIGAWLSGRVTGRFGYGRSLVVTLIMGNSAPLALVLSAEGSAGAFALYAGALAVSGFGIGLANAQAVTVRQVATPEHLRGRVNAAYRFLTWGMIAVGAVLAGVVVSGWGPFTAMLVGAIGTTTATLWVVFSPVRRLRDLKG